MITVPGVARLHVIEGASILRPQAAIFEKTLQGFGDHQRARHLSPDTIGDCTRIAHQVQRSLADIRRNRSAITPWSAMLADQVATSTLRGHQGDLALHLTT